MKFRAPIILVASQLVAVVFGGGKGQDIVQAKVLDAWKKTVRERAASLTVKGETKDEIKTRVLNGKSQPVAEHLVVNLKELEAEQDLSQVSLDSKKFKEEKVVEESKKEPEEDEAVVIAAEFQPKPMGTPFMRALKLLHVKSVTQGHRVRENDVLPEHADKGRPFLVFFAVFSTPFGFERRQAVRDGLFQEPILQPGANGSLAKGRARFFIGLPSVETLRTEEGLQNVQKLIQEIEQYGDIVMIRKQDTYRGSGFKHQYIYEYVSYPYQLSHFLMKIDDDVYCKTAFLARHLAQRLKDPKHYYYMGAFMYGARPHRDPNSKYYMSLEEYPREVHPPFASGTGNLLSIEVVALLLQQDLYFYSMEDISVAIWLETLQKEKKLDKPLLFDSLPDWYIFGLPEHIPDPNFVHSLSPQQMRCFYEYERKHISDKQPCNRMK
jgi:hypothetical protein